MGGGCDLDRSRKDVALNGGDRLPAGIQTPPRRPPGACFQERRRITKDCVQLRLCLGLYVGGWGGWRDWRGLLDPLESDRGVALVSLSGCICVLQSHSKCLDF